MTDIKILNEITQAISSATIKYTCLLWYGEYGAEENVGTGNLIIHDDCYYLLTCEHVATEFFGSKNAVAGFGNANFLDLSEMEYYKESKEDDLALIKILNRNKMGGLLPKKISDFSFKKLDDEHEALYYFCGFPAEEVKAAQEKRGFNGLTHFAPALKDKCTEHKLYLEYDKSHPMYPLPNPKGFSGSLIFEYINASSAKKMDKIWYPTLGKAVSVLCRSDTRAYVMGTTIRKLKDWLLG
jgi:hypothetical protein